MVASRTAGSEPDTHQYFVNLADVARHSATGDSAVNAGDAIITRNRSGQMTDTNNFRSDYNLDGFINAGDATIVRSRSRQSIP
ncbi:MAG: hypothetical protein H0V18_17165 [Pyrinomonadaceae bacterium]|nr:hypothetical protein [Pyrinomonadaceae bacterium]